MKVRSMNRTLLGAFVIASVACAGNQASTTDSNNAAAAPRDSTAAMSDSATANQTESGMIDSTGTSTLGPKADQTRPDQGQPVTAKGDTLNTGVDSSTTAR